MDPSASRAIVFVFTLIACAISGSAQTAPPARANGPSTTAELIARFRHAHDARSIDEIRQLVYWGRTSDDNRRAFEHTASADFGKTIASAAVEPVGRGETFEYAQGGITFKPTLPPTGKLTVAFAPTATANKDSTTYLVGQSGGSYWLLTAEASR